MLAEIGVMIGFYIITRALSFLTRSDPAKESIIVKIFSIITIIVTLFVIADLSLRGASTNIAK
jgi:hypothetical protein